MISLQNLPFWIDLALYRPPAAIAAHCGAAWTSALERCQAALAQTGPMRDENGQTKIRLSNRLKPYRFKPDTKLCEETSQVFFTVFRRQKGHCSAALHWLHLHLYSFIFVCLHTFVSVCDDIYIYIYMPACVCVCVSVMLYVSRFISYVCTRVYVYMYLFVHLFIDNICLFAYL